MRPNTGASPLTCRSPIENSGSISLERLVSVDAKLSFPAGAARLCLVSRRRGVTHAALPHRIRPFISVPRLPRFDVNATSGVNWLQTTLQFNHTLDLFRERQSGEVAASLRFGIPFRRKRTRLCHFSPSSTGQVSPCAAHISANAFLSNRSYPRNAWTRSLSFIRPV